MALALEQTGRLFPKPVAVDADQKPSDRIHELAHGVADAVSEQGLDRYAQTSYITYSRFAYHLCPVHLSVLAILSCQ